MMKYLIFLHLVLFSRQFVDTSPIISYNSTENRTVNNNGMSFVDQDNFIETYDPEYAEQLIEEVKHRILTSLHKTEAPKEHVPLPVLYPLFFYSETGENQTTIESHSNATERTKTEFIFANVGNTSFSDESGNTSVKFRIDLSTAVQNKDFEAAELWLFKYEDITDLSVTRIINSTDVTVEEKLTATVYNLTHSKGWIRLNVSQMLYNENTTYLDIEVSSNSVGMCLEVDNDKLPFLLVRTKERSIHKRSLNECNSENSTCCKKELYIDFKDIGYDEWIVGPEGYNANYCKGTCTDHIGLPSNGHGRVLMALCKKKPDMARQMGKAECLTCVPTSYHNVSIIYVDEEGVHVVSHMPEMAVTGCGCL